MRAYLFSPYAPCPAPRLREGGSDDRDMAGKYRDGISERRLLLPLSSFDYRVRWAQTSLDAGSIPSLATFIYRCVYDAVRKNDNIDLTALTLDFSSKYIESSGDSRRSVVASILYYISGEPSILVHIRSDC